jgi:hypothetical protein
LRAATGLAKATPRQQEPYPPGSGRIVDERRFVVLVGLLVHHRLFPAHLGLGVRQRLIDEVDRIRARNDACLVKIGFVPPAAEIGDPGQMHA